MHIVIHTQFGFIPQMSMALTKLYNFFDNFFLLLDIQDVKKIISTKVFINFVILFFYTIFLSFPFIDIHPAIKNWWMSWHLAEELECSSGSSWSRTGRRKNQQELRQLISWNCKSHRGIDLEWIWAFHCEFFFLHMNSLSLVHASV